MSPKRRYTMRGEDAERARLVLVQAWRGLSTILLELGITECSDASETQMVEEVEAVEETCDGLDRDVFAVRQMDPLQRG